MSKTPRPDAGALDIAHGLHQAGRLDEAVQAYGKAARQPATRLPALFGLGTLELQRGQAKTAVTHLQQAARLAPDHPGVQTNLGHARLQAGDAGAVDAFRRACELADKDPGNWFNLGYALQTTGRQFEAAEAYARATALAPDDPAAHNNLAGVMQELGRASAAAEHYGTALARLPDDPGIAFNLCLALEAAGQDAEARRHADALRVAAPDDPRPWYLLARLDRRDGDTDAARGNLEAALARQPDNDLGASIHREMALLLDGLGDYDAAFAAARRGNALKTETARRRGLDGRRWRQRLAGYRARLDADLLRRWAARPLPDDGPAPLFFVGFPRSGTTLVETLLAAHPALLTSGEHTPLDYVLQALELTTTDDVATVVAGLQSKRLDRLRGVFRWAADGLFGDLADGRRLVDKAPFSLAELGLINGLFPDTRVIVALRDPRDVCLSCLMQDFTLSDATACLLDVESAARLYADTMALWLHYRDALTVPTLAYRYEDLVADPAAVGERLFDFIGLDWQPDLLAQRGTGQAMHIGTPSRDAVARPISRRAVGRWHNYERHLAPALPVLAPLLAALGYDDN